MLSTITSITQKIKSRQQVVKNLRQLCKHVIGTINGCYDLGVFYVFIYLGVCRPKPILGKKNTLTIIDEDKKKTRSISYIIETIVKDNNIMTYNRTHRIFWLSFFSSISALCF
jgi:hypothetical protein